MINAWIRRALPRFGHPHLVRQGGARVLCVDFELWSDQADLVWMARYRTENLVSRTSNMTQVAACHRGLSPSPRTGR